MYAEINAWYDDMTY